MAKEKSPCGEAGPECYRNTDPWSDGGVTHVAVCSVCGGRFKTSKYHTLPLHEHAQEKKSGE